jgi:PPK2 family polyphosphate:nucleotide phosphotransferase
MSRIDDMRVEPGGKVQLKDHDPGDRLGWKTKDDALAASAKLEDQLRELVAKLAATRVKAVLLVLQGMDAAGKDGTTRAAFSQISPTFLKVASFKAPTSTELAHDFLWRVHAALPERGQVGVFNRSHYEDVLVVRVDSLVPKEVWSRRYDAINAFEQHLTDEDTVIVKCMLNVSREAQRKRLQERLKDPTKSWKFSADDIKKRAQWEDYMEAYRDVLDRTSTSSAPWYVVPADHNSVRNAAVTELLVHALDRLGMEWPALDPAVKSLAIE